MERMHVKHFDTMPLSAMEHRHRYQYAAQFARGTVLDAACGIGYGADILEAGGAELYTGIDYSDAAISEAKETFSKPSRTFYKGLVDQLPFEDAQFDLVVSLETLEHVPDVDAALREFRRVLKFDGMLVASVPDKHFDEYVSASSGASNEFHLHRFDREEIGNLMLKHFRHVRVGYAEMVIASRVCFSSSLPDCATTSTLVSADAGKFGSFFIVASNCDIPTCEQHVGGYMPFFKEHLSIHKVIQERDATIASLRAEEKSGRSLGLWPSIHRWVAFAVKKYRHYMIFGIHL